MLGHDRGTFGINLIECGPVREHHCHADIPIVGGISGGIGPHFVITDDAFLLQRIVDRLQVLAKIFPEGFPLAWLQVVVSDAPYWANVLVRILRIRGQRGEQRQRRQHGQDNFSHRIIFSGLW